MSVVLREIIPDGTRWGIRGELLPHWTNLEFGQDLRSGSSIKFEYADQGSNVDKLKNGVYVVPEIDGYQEWFDSVFYVKATEGSNLPNSTGTTTLTGTSLKTRLENVRWMPAVGSQYIDSEGFRYTNVTPGDIIKGGVENYLSRAKKTYKDATNWLIGAPTGTGWVYRVDEVIRPTTSVMEMINKYQDLGMANSRFYGFELITGHYDWFTDNSMRDKTETVQLKVGLNLSRSEYTESIEDLTTALLVRGAEDPFKADDENNMQTNVVQWVFASQGIINKYGYHERILDVSSASNPETLKAVGKNYIKRYQQPRYSQSFTMEDHLYDPETGEPLDTPKALIDFQCGDAILILSGAGASVETVYAITMSFNNPASQASIGLTLNDAFDSWEVKFSQRLKRLEG